MLFVCVFFNWIVNEKRNESIKIGLIYKLAGSIKIKETNIGLHTFKFAYN